MKKYIYIISIIAIFIDQFAKQIIENNIELGSSIDVIKNLFYITNVHNDGAAFSMLSGNRVFLILFSFVVLALIYFVFLDTRKADKIFTKIDILCYGLIIGGIIGNLIDRIIYGYVIDFIGIDIFGYKFPIFNFSDTFIVISVGIMIIYLLRTGRNDYKCM